MEEARAAVRIFSNFAEWVLAAQRGPLELGGGTTVNLAERCTEMAVAGEAELQTESGQVVILRQKIQRTRQPQAQLIAVQGETFDLLEDLREINGRAAH